VCWIPAQFAEALDYEKIMTNADLLTPKGPRIYDYKMTNFNDYVVQNIIQM